MEKRESDSCSYLEGESWGARAGVPADGVSTVVVTIAVMGVCWVTFVDVITSKSVAVQGVPGTTVTCVGADVVGAALSTASSVCCGTFVQVVAREAICTEIVAPDTATHVAERVGVGESLVGTVAVQTVTNVRYVLATLVVVIAVQTWRI